MDAGKINHQLITYQIDRTCRNILKLRIILPADIGLQIFIVIIIKNDIKTLGKFPAHFSLYNFYVFFCLLGYITGELAAGGVIMINTEMLCFKKLPFILSGLNPVLPKGFHISLRFQICWLYYNGQKSHSCNQKSFILET